MHYHLIGIGGIGMGAIASLLSSKGHKVSGCDLRENDMTRRLTDKGMDVFYGHHSQHINGANRVVYSSAIKKNNIERLNAQNKGIVLQRRASCLAELMQDHVGITVVGAHGKTTTSSMLAHMLMSCQMDPTVAIGGILNKYEDNAFLGQSPYFVAELDESDGSFLEFNPKYSVITNIDNEHLDFYKDYMSLIDAYYKFTLRTKPDGLIWGFGDDEMLMSVLAQSKVPFNTFGLSSKNDIWADEIQSNDLFIDFQCHLNEGQLGLIHLPVPGRHNVLNALAAVGIGLTLDLSFSQIKHALESYPGVQRRFQVIGRSGGVMVVDDYAHHPSEIKAALDTAQHVKSKRLVAVFQPHRYSRLQSMSKAFAQSLANCDHLIVTDVFAAGETPIPGVSSKDFFHKNKSGFPSSCEYVSQAELAFHLSVVAQEGDLILSLGAGDISSLFHSFVKRMVSCHTNV